MKKEVFKSILVEMWDYELPPIVRREMFFDVISSRKPVGVIGPRRSGKTFFLYQLIRDLRERIDDPRRIIYVNFEDSRLLPLESGDGELLLDAYYEIFPDGKDVEKFFFLDEVQNLPFWQAFVRRLVDFENARVIVTGSSSRVLKEDLARELRGRMIYHEMLPFSFREFLLAKGIRFNHEVVYGKLRHRILSLFDEYLLFGGYPEVVLEDNKLMKIRILQSYFDTMIYKDILDRYNINNKALLYDLIKYLFTNIGRLFSATSYFKLVKQRMRVSKNTITEYLKYLEDAMLIFAVSKYSRTKKEEILSPRKIYAVDTGLRNAIVYRKDLPAMFENIVFLHLLRIKMKYPWIEINYWRGEKGIEVDFLIKAKDEPICAIQTSYNIESVETELREIRALKELNKKMKIYTLILTRDQNYEKDDVKVINFPKFLLETMKTIEEKAQEI